MLSRDLSIFRGVTTWPLGPLTVSSEDELRTGETEPFATWQLGDEREVEAGPQ